MYMYKYIYIYTSVFTPILCRYVYTCAHNIGKIGDPEPLYTESDSLAK